MDMLGSIMDMRGPVMDMRGPVMDMLGPVMDMTIKTFLNVVLTVTHILVWGPMIMYRYGVTL